MTEEKTWKSWLIEQGLADLVLYDLPAGSPTLSQKWILSDQDKAAAWPFLIELRSRVVTRYVHPRSGDERAALDSVYQLFPTFRRLAEGNPGCTRFATLALDVLDRYVRPFTARWHKKSLAGRLESMDESAVFRLELRSVQDNLRRTLKLFALLADVEPASVLCDLTPATTTALDLLELAPVSADANLEEVFKSERGAIAQRRGLFARVDGTPPEPLYDGVGLALSGGGIRSATFSLGVVAQLAHRGILDQVDYLSTVSGGGYLGSFISALLGQTDPKESATSIFGSRGAGDTSAIRALRNHSRYLIEGGVRAILSFLGLMLSGVMASIVMVIPVLAAVTLLVDGLNQGRNWIDQNTFWITTTVLFLGFGGVLLAQRWCTRVENWIAQGWIVTLLLVLYLWLGSRPWNQWITTIDHASWTVVVTVTSIVFIALLRSPSPQSKGLLGLVVWLAGPLLLLEAAIVTQVALGLTDRQLLVVIVAGFGVTFLVNLNVASPHRFYRDRVASTYVLKTQKTGDPVPASLRLSELNPAGRAPYHLINAALNVPGSRSLENRGRNTEFFLFSKHWCGSRSTKYFETSKWQDENPQLSLASAIAISGAAAAPNMGINQASRYRIFLAMLNVRLDYWIRRPEQTGWFWAWLYFWREMLGSMSERSTYVNVSDGGHIENLGIYELLRRQCKFVIAIDGEADPLRQFGSLVNLTQFAYIDLGIRIDPDLSNLRIDEEGIGKTHFEMFRIQYPGESKVGLLLYIKASLTGNESEFLRRYRAEHPDFPHESTAKQLYSERQFEAYRALGEHIARDLFEEPLSGKDARSYFQVAEWMAHLAQHLLVTPASSDHK